MVVLHWTLTLISPAGGLKFGSELGGGPRERESAGWFVPRPVGGGDSVDGVDRVDLNDRIDGVEQAAGAVR